MIHVFNRKELITTVSDKQLYRIQTALADAGVPYSAKSKIPFFTADRYRGMPFVDQDATHPTAIYVKAVDYDRAKAAIRTV